MKTKIAFFAARRYWKNNDELQNAYQILREDLSIVSKDCVLITEEDSLKLLETGGDCLIIVPMSGAVQRLILSAANKFNTLVIYPAYIKGNSGDIISNKMLENNAAPTTMDCWAVLKRTHKHIRFAMNMEEMQKCIRIFRAYIKVQGATILLIGKTEPWVISNSSDLKCYEKLGVKVKEIEQAEVAQVFRSMTDENAAEFYKYFKGDEKAIIEPSNEDIKASCRMAAALMKVIQKYAANGVALACFNLLEEGTNCCLGVSYLNDCTEYVASCEGDVDCAITKLAMKQIASTKLWMANPGLHPDKTINFSHCTAPLNMYNKGKCSYTLRSHHESGIGTSLQVEYPVGQTVK